MSLQVNPIAVKENGRTIGVIPIDIETDESSLLLVILNEDEQVIAEGVLDEESMFSIDTKNSIIQLVFKKIKGESIVKKETISIGEKFAKKDSDKAMEKELELSAGTYERLYNLVKAAMDSPKGTPEEIEEHTRMLNKTTEDAKARHYVESRIRQVISTDTTLTDSDVYFYTNKLYANLYGMGILQPIDDDETIGEIIVNGYVYPTFRCDIYYYQKGKKVKYDKTFDTYEEMYNVFSRAIAFSKKELNNVENAMVEAMRSNRDRVNILIPDASESYVMNIRKFGNFVPDANSMKKSGTVDDLIERLMDVLVRGKANIGIGGEMGTGKTSFINYLLTYTVKDELKVVISSVAETDVERVLKGHHVVILNVDEDKGFTFEKQIRASLRTTASRIIIPESRGAEFKQVYEANLKTKGNMFTAHALDDYSFLDMCVDMYLGDSEGSIGQIKDKIAKSVDIIIIMRKVGDEIRIKSISEVYLNERREYENMNLLYEWVQDDENPDKGKYVRTENRLSTMMKKRLNESGVPLSHLTDF